MHKPSFRRAPHARRLVSSLTVAALAVLVALACSDVIALAQTAAKGTDAATRPDYREPVTLTSKDGVLEVRLTARQGQATLDTVATPVQNFLLFDYELIRGTASNGRSSGGNLYPAPTLQALADAGIDMDDVTDKLLRDGIDAFMVPMQKLLDGIEAKRAEIAG